MSAMLDAVDDTEKGFYKDCLANSSGGNPNKWFLTEDEKSNIDPNIVTADVGFDNRMLDSVDDAEVTKQFLGIKQEPLIWVARGFSAH